MCLICTKEYDIDATSIYCCRNVKKIPKELIKSKALNCNNTNVKKIPKTLINLKSLICGNTQIKFIPKTLINLKYLYCDNDVLISPQTYIKEPNNQYYLTFTRCQARYKKTAANKLRLKNLKFAYDPKYIIGHNTKKQLERFFQN
jgi:hypothetical protein